jgi:hypothetical protein
MLNRASSSDDYERLFPDLPPLVLKDERLSALVADLLRPVRVPDNPDVPAGYTYFGQLVAHDLSRMLGGRNLNSSRLWLDTVYGDHPEGRRHLYRQSKAGDRIFVLGRGATQLGSPSMELDLPRTESGSPEIPDERDDFHIIISQMHLAFMLLHNRLTMDLRDRYPRQSSAWIFDTARRECCRLYQWIIVNDFLRRVCDHAALDAAWPAAEIAALDPGRSLGKAKKKIALEFVLAGYRFGHSMVRSSYALNDALPRRPIFHPRGSTEWNADWRGHRKLPVHWSVQWNLFFSYPNSTPQKARCMSTSIASSFGDLPAFTVADDHKRRGIVNLAERTLRAGQEALLPSGQDVAREILRGIPPRLQADSVKIVDPGQYDPLWYYILREAFEASGGRTLGPVGTWIVASSIFSILVANQQSYVHDPSWAPSLPCGDKSFELRDLIRYAGLPVSHEDWNSYVSGRLPEWA